MYENSVRFRNSMSDKLQETQRNLLAGGKIEKKNPLQTMYYTDVAAREAIQNDFCLFVGRLFSLCLAVNFAERISHNISHYNTCYYSACYEYVHYQEIGPLLWKDTMRF